jgi:hypothetical protein
MYAVITIRPDVSFIAGQLAQHREKPGPGHWKGAKRVLRYLARTTGYASAAEERTLTEIMATLTQTMLVTQTAGDPHLDYFSR